MQTTYDFAGSTDMWSTSAGGHLMKVVNLTGFTVLSFIPLCMLRDDSPRNTPPPGDPSGGVVYLWIVLSPEESSRM